MSIYEFAKSASCSGDIKKDFFNHWAIFCCKLFCTILYENLNSSLKKLKSQKIFEKKVFYTFIWTCSEYFHSFEYTAAFCSSGFFANSKNLRFPKK